MPKKLSDLLEIYQSNKEKLAGGSLTEEERKEAECEKVDHAGGSRYGRGQKASA